MTLRSFTPKSVTSIAAADDDAHISVSFDANQKPFIWWIDQSGSIKVDCLDGGLISIPAALSALYRFPIVQRFADGRWLIVDARTRRGSENAVVLSSSFDKIVGFHVGDAVQDILIDSQDRIWIGYFDESGGKGLIRYTATGEATYDFNLSSGLNIFHSYAMTADNSGDVWVYPHTEFFLAKIHNDNAQVILEKSPVSGARAICVGGGFAVFFGSYDGNEITILEIDSGKTRSVLLKADGREIEPKSISTRGEAIAVLSKEGVYQFQLIDLIKTADFR